jgi:hypothetical protein
MAERFQLPIPKVQQIAFRLIVVGLVEEVPDIDLGMVNKVNEEKAIATDANVQAVNKSERTEISNSFLQSLVGFLQRKA